MRRADSFEETLILRKIEGGRRRGQQRMRWWMALPTQWTWIWVNSRSWWWAGRSGVLQSMGLQRVGPDRVNWTEIIYYRVYFQNFSVTLLFLGFCCCLIAKSCPTLFVTPWTVARQAPLSMGFLRQEYWSGLQFPSPWDLSRDQTCISCIAGGFFSTEQPGKSLLSISYG